MAQHTVAWIAADWGTSHLRVSALGADGTVRDHAHSDKGMGTLAPDQFEAALLELIAPWLGAGRTLPVYACGMVGARQGWIEAPYGAVPGAPLGARPVEVSCADPRITVTIVPGLAQSDPPDVMRGEETQIAGLIAANPALSGAVCLPGTHSKWVGIERGVITGFTTMMTGELFALLANRSVLRHSVQTDAWSDEGFAQGLDTAVAAPDTLTGQLFAIRAQSLLEDPGPAVSRATLSGLLIGAELAAARRYWQSADVALVGDETLCGLYRTALARLEVKAKVYDARRLTLEGLAAARNRYEEERL